MAEAFTPDLQPELDRKNKALADRIVLMEKQAADERARFLSEDERKAASPKRAAKK